MAQKLPQKYLTHMDQGKQLRSKILENHQFFNCYTHGIKRDQWTRIDHESIVGAQAFLVRFAFFGFCVSAAAGEAGSVFWVLFLAGVPLPPDLLGLVLLPEDLAGFVLLRLVLGLVLDPVPFPALSSFNSFAKCLQQ